jgi:hypothetical protein
VFDSLVPAVDYAADCIAEISRGSHSAQRRLQQALAHAAGRSSSSARGVRSKAKHAGVAEDPVARYRAALPSLKRLPHLPELTSAAGALHTFGARLRPSLRFAVAADAECLRRGRASEAAVASACRVTAHAAAWRRSNPIPIHSSPPRMRSSTARFDAPVSSSTPCMPRVPTLPRRTAPQHPSTPAARETPDYTPPKVRSVREWIVSSVERSLLTSSPRCLH